MSPISVCVGLLRMILIVKPRGMDRYVVLLDGKEHKTMLKTEISVSGLAWAQLHQSY